nr:NAD(P)-dependent oxidoreductase [uncultured Cupriavidus sp.]
MKTLMKETTKRHVGFIGLGAMGHGIAKNVLAHGYETTVLLRRPEDRARHADLLAQGANAVSSVSDVARVSDVVIICVTDSAQVEQVILSPDGLAASLRWGTVVIDCSTALPESTRRVAAAIEANGGLFLDAALTGTPKEAEAGRLNLLVGGRPEVISEVEPLLSTFSLARYHCGPVSAGHAMKLLHQFVVLSNTAVLAEAFACAQKAGVDQAVLCDVIASGGANSTAFQRIRPFVEAGNDESFRFSLANAAKDMRYHEQMAANSGSASFIGASVLGMYTVATNQGLVRQSVPHLIHCYNKINGISPGAQETSTE